MTAICELCDRNPIGAIGRCGLCGKAYCRSHAAVVWPNTPHLSQCQRCIEPRLQAIHENLAKGRSERAQSRAHAKALVPRAAEALLARGERTYPASILKYQHRQSMGSGGPSWCEPGREMGPMWPIRTTGDGEYYGEKYFGLHANGLLFPLDVALGDRTPLVTVRMSRFGKRSQRLALHTERRGAEIKAIPVDFDPSFESDEGNKWKWLVNSLEAIVSGGPPAF